MADTIKVIISGGGTGGHVFPAIAIAQALQKIDNQIEFLFVGAEGKMEMTKVPAAGFAIVGLPIVGLQRKLTLKNVWVPFKLFMSLYKARKILQTFKPNIAIGVGGYASGPLLRMAGWMGIPTLVQEQNSYPGITNKLLAKKAERICVAYSGLEKYFPAEKLILTGNPIRPMVIDTASKRDKGQQFFGLHSDKKTVLIVGGSLGARTINESVANSLVEWKKAGLQVIWQTGTAYYATAKLLAANHEGVHVFDFISEMDMAYGASDLIISRAGAMSISELCIVAKPCILIPSPNVAEDHQTKNALALVESNAALMLADKDARAQLCQMLLSLQNDPTKCQTLANNCAKLGHVDAAGDIAKAILEIIHQKTKESRR